MSRLSEAQALHANLQLALVALQVAEQRAVSVFARIMAGKLHRELGYPSIHLHHCTREQVLLMALEAFDGESSPRGNSASPYQVMVYRCEDCGTSRVQGQPLGAAEADQVDCDAQVLEPGKRSLRTIAPSRRRAVLRRDSHRCRRCGSSRFLEIHHVKAVGQGGGNSVEILITLCSRCHRHLHEQSGRARARRPEPG